MTKSFTAMSILKLRDEGRLSLDDAADKYVPELKDLKYRRRTPAHHDQASAVALRRVSRGQPVGRSHSWRTPTSRCCRCCAGGFRSRTRPASPYEYSNYGFAILGRIVSRVSGRRTTTYVSDNILRPLGMTSTTLHVEGAGQPHRAGLPVGGRSLERRALAAARIVRRDGRHADVESRLQRYVGAFLSAWPPRDGAETGPIRRASLREMQQAWRPSGMRVTRDAATGARVWRPAATRSASA
jgi:CubicO group peptidase (beta-lactamase class C family)